MYVIIHLSKPIDCIIPRVNPKVDHGLWVIMMCQYRSILGKICAILVNNVDNGEGNACVGAEGIREISLPPSRCCKPKAALKKRSLIQNKTKTLESKSYSVMEY